MSDEFFRRGRVAAALVAGPAVTVGLMGVAAPAFAQEGTGAEDQSAVDENFEDADSSSADSGSEGGSEGEAADSPEAERAEAGQDAEEADQAPSADDAANEGTSETDAEELEIEEDADEPQDEDEDGEDDNGDEGEDDGASEDDGNGDDDAGDDDAGEDDDENGDRSDQLTLDTAAAYPGDEITVVGEDFDAEENVAFSLNPELGTAPADANGVVTAVLTIPEDVPPGDYALTAVGETSGHTAAAGLTILDPEDDAEVPEIDPDLSIDTEQITLEDFIGDPEQGAGVNHVVDGLAPGQPIEWLVTGPEGVNENIGAATASDEGVVDFRIHGFETPEPAIYLGEYTTVVAVEGEDGEVIELEATFTVVDGTEDDDQNGTPGDDEAAPPEDDGSETPPSDGNDEQVPPEGDGDAETPSKGEGHDEQVPAHDEGDAGTPAKGEGEEQHAPSHDDGGTLTKDEGAHHEGDQYPDHYGDHYADHQDEEPAADSAEHEGSPSAREGDELANTGSNLTAGILSGLLVALGAGLAFFGYRHRIGRHSA